MPKIHWIAYVLIGLFISISSYVINFDYLVFFFYIGWIFVIVGIFRMAIGFGKNKSQEKLQHAKPQARNPQYKYCQRCRNILRIQDKFCPRCGSKV